MLKTSAVIKILVTIAALAIIAGAVFIFLGYADDYSEPVYRQFTLYSGGTRILDKEYQANPSLNSYTASGDKTLADVYNDYLSGGMERTVVLDFMFDNLGTELEEKFTELDVPAIDATVEFHANQSPRFVYIDAVDGTAVDREKFYSLLEKSFTNEKTEITLTTYAVPATVQADDLKALTVQRGVFTTLYRTSGASRRANVALASGAISGTVINAGESFSFNGIVGERTAERGYKEANIILDGAYVKGVGGGVCQVSSTLYNSALLAGLDVTTWARHTLSSSYVKPSFDAMVSGTQDMCFVNTTEYPIYIEMTATDGKLTARIFGKALDENTEIKLVSKVLKVIQPPSYNVVYDDTMYEDESKITISAHTGYISEGYLEKYIDGKLTERIKLRYDEYKATAGTITKGTKKREHGRHDYEHGLWDYIDGIFD